MPRYRLELEFDAPLNTALPMTTALVHKLLPKYFRDRVKVEEVQIAALDGGDPVPSRKDQDSPVRTGNDPLVCRFTYANYEGVVSARRVVPFGIWFGSTPWHKEKQWLLRAYDLDKGADRDFALVDIQGRPSK